MVEPRLQEGQVQIVADTALMQSQPPQEAHCLGDDCKFIAEQEVAGFEDSEEVSPTRRPSHSPRRTDIAKLFPVQSSMSSLPLAQLGDCLMKRRRRGGCRAATRSFPPMSSWSQLSRTSDEDFEEACVSASSTATDLSEGEGPRYTATFSEMLTASMATNHGSMALTEVSSWRMYHRPLCSRLCFLPRFQLDEEVIYAGTVAKRSRHLGLWRVRWAVLTPKSLLTFRDPADLVNTPTEHFKLNEVQTIIVEGLELEIELEQRWCELRFQEACLSELW
eukprot:CAMPEP_0197657392 /NCGR_PEP_ID=MMETSP1338-20131121/44597_1 /TAXON_ID=43686 ORGANISM="Pelagodinium beii, Strain RCC1491" /NCGR_SAMPLE_ID=MMETSP1338 /ASSEMBLY_ACC=CAM_ASM_000754 /LENGTH=276 /DNA_ID=CAMNT_0043233743 /DNA_START=34 /DNA_END=861 /DNA_ORIENTATION=-